MKVSPDAIRESMRHWTTGIAILASQYNGLRHGMTVSSFTSVSLDPPKVLVSVQKDTRTYDLIIHSGFFSITILTEDQQEISDRFAGRLSEYTDRFEGLSIETLQTDSPIIVGGLASFDCKVVKLLEQDTHTLVIGEVLATQESDNGRPLAYYNRSYRRLQD